SAESRSLVSTFAIQRNHRPQPIRPGHLLQPPEFFKRQHLDLSLRSGSHGNEPALPFRRVVCRGRLPLQSETDSLSRFSRRTLNPLERSPRPRRQLHLHQPHHQPPAKPWEFPFHRKQRQVSPTAPSRPCLESTWTPNRPPCRIRHVQRFAGRARLPCRS